MKTNKKDGAYYKKNSNNNNNDNKEYVYKINDFYEYFKLSRNCAGEHIKRRYLTFLLNFHPDKNQHLNAYPEYKEMVDKMNEINMIGGKILLNVKARQIYNRMLSLNLFPSHANVYFENINILNMICDFSGIKHDDLFC